MTRHAKGTFDVKSMKEDTYDEYDDGTKVTHARIEQMLSGDLDGEMTIDCIMRYASDGKATIVGFQRFVGRMGDQEGSVVFQSIGGYDGEKVKSDWSVVDGSGTGDLAKLKATGTSKLPHGSKGEYTLDYAA
jgi:hypothetical protein